MIAFNRALFATTCASYVAAQLVADTEHDIRSYSFAVPAFLGLIENVINIENVKDDLCAAPEHKSKNKKSNVSALPPAVGRSFRSVATAWKHAETKNAGGERALEVIKAFIDYMTTEQEADCRANYEAWLAIPFKGKDEPKTDTPARWATAKQAYLNRLYSSRPENFAQFNKAIAEAVKTMVSVDSDEDDTDTAPAAPAAPAAPEPLDAPVDNAKLAMDSLMSLLGACNPALMVWLIDDMKNLQVALGVMMAKAEAAGSGVPYVALAA